MNIEGLTISLSEYGSVRTCNTNGSNTDSFIIRIDNTNTDIQTCMNILTTINSYNNNEYPYIWSVGFDGGFFVCELNKNELY